MANSKVTYFGRVLIDLTEDSVTPETLLEGATAHNAKGEIIQGSYAVPSGTLHITESGTHDVTKYASVTVDISGEDLEAVISEQEALIEELRVALANKATTSEDLEAVISEQEALINELREALANKATTSEDLEAVISEQEELIRELRAALADKATTSNELERVISEQEALIDELRDTLTNKVTTAEEYESVITEQEALINELREALDGKVSDNAVDTCTVTFQSYTGEYYATVLADNVPTAVKGSSSSVISNVVKGSILIIPLVSGGSFYATGATLLSDISQVCMFSIDSNEVIISANSSDM